MPVVPVTTARWSQCLFSWWQGTVGTDRSVGLFFSLGHVWGPVLVYHLFLHGQWYYCQCPGSFQAKHNSPVLSVPFPNTTNQVSPFGPWNFGPLLIVVSTDVQAAAGASYISTAGSVFAGHHIHVSSVQVFIEVIIDSYVLRRNSSERPRLHFTQFIPMVTFCKTRVCHNQDINIGTTHWSFSDFTRFTCTCVCVGPYSLITIYSCRFVYLPPQSRCKTVLSPTDLSCLPFIATLSLLIPFHT